MWTQAPADLDLQPHQVDVWRVFLNLEPDSLASAESTLSTTEIQRASRFRFNADRHRYIAAHGSLRRILARYLQCDPRASSFSANDYGKPALLGDKRLEFNLSHSGDYALIAVARHHQVGIDVERRREGLDIEHIAARYFSPGEIAELTALPSEQRATGFFNCWTRKEAYIKGHGLGMSMALDSFTVSLTPGKPALLLATRPDAGVASRWTLLSLEVDASHAGALAVEGRGLDFRYWDWTSAGN